MSNPTYKEIQYDVGDTRTVTDGTTAIKSFIAKAQQDVRDITGTTVNFDNAIRNLADVYTINAALGGLGPESVGQAHWENMKKTFEENFKNALLRKGYSPDGISMKWESTT